MRTWELRTKSFCFWEQPSVALLSRDFFAQKTAQWSYGHSLAVAVENCGFAFLHRKNWHHQSEVPNEQNLFE